mmetsp:Transcript_27298/g.59662  ORF Transcript_27298/g.59662 Transcript_27298/m.59662 type:complete len:469 (+) Transcript_27298:78-1484(+)
MAVAFIVLAASVVLCAQAVQENTAGIKTVSVGASVSKAASPKFAWERIHAQSSKASGSTAQPSIRYGHSIVSFEDALVMNHGYYFDRDASSATWLSDVWSMKLSPPHSWSLLHAGIPQHHAHDAYSNDRDRLYAPAGRFGHGIGMYNGSLWMYGGHDGGISRHGRQNYEPGYDFDELWQYSISEDTWRLIKSTNPDSTPGKRYLLATTVVADMLVLTGGILEGQGDVWAYHFAQNKWERLSAEHPRQEGGPGRRVGHSITPVDYPAPGGGRVRGFFMYGGRWVTSHGDTELAPEVFFFDLNTHEWKVVEVVGEKPPLRKYHGTATAWVPITSLGGGADSADKYAAITVVSGGTTTTPGLTCAADAWVLMMSCDASRASWQRLPDMPTGVYDARMAANSQGIYTYGGHLCTNSKTDEYFYWYLNSVDKLSFSAAGITLSDTACQVSKADLPAGAHATMPAPPNKGKAEL